ncbi:type IV secretory system conjugative DNA transfer family protein [Acuticoccus yangtzensis]|uniref:type IV secretory system conjugative DNA transfer family protein n=1 Tax=Acuticoccus yangtzensis TaxID=1443441 RepID=UPI000D3E1B65|nr:type IV secretory system conjugative DNA transfer family protein [Acuticoccus yangtzensis]
MAFTGFPRGLAKERTVSSLATASWFDPVELERDAKSGGEFAYRSGKIWLGRSAAGDGVPVGWLDDKHMVTVAGSRAGKGTSAIIPVLCDYPGSVICIDPKGENAYRTASRRGFGTTTIKGLNQDVYVLDPFGVSGVRGEYLASFDPLADLDGGSQHTLEEAALIAEALVLSGNTRDPHWDESARILIEGVILHVVTSPHYAGRRHLGMVQALVRDGDREHYAAFGAHVRQNGSETAKRNFAKWTPFDSLLTLMEENDAFNGVISGAALAIKSMGPNERGSVLSTARRNLKFLELPAMQRCLMPSAHTLQLEDLKRVPHGVSVYLVLPARFMKTHARWMRLMLNLTVSRLERDAAKPASNHPVLAVLDEFAILGHMPVLESAVGYMAGFGLKLWAILQDLSQLKRHYETSWETFLGNAGLIQFFGNVDMTTLEHISKRLGELEVITEVDNEDVSIAQSTADMSDFEKASQLQGRGLGSLVAGFRFANETTSQSTTKTTSNRTTQNIQKTSLLTPDEIRMAFARETGLQLIASSDKQPLFLYRSEYYKDNYFTGKYNERM